MQLKKPSVDKIKKKALQLPFICGITSLIVFYSTSLLKKRCCLAAFYMKKIPVTEWVTVLFTSRSLVSVVIIQIRLVVIKFT